jgi:sialate O-acetylesterase
MLIGLRHPRRWVAVILGLLAMSGTAFSQATPRVQVQRKDQAREVVEIKVAAPISGQVFQRDSNGHADIPVELTADRNDVVISTAVLYKNQVQVEGVVFSDGKLRNVPTGGPYSITVYLDPIEKKGTNSGRVMGTQVAGVTNIFVGDLWVLAGQSNMQGVGDLINVEPTHPLVRSLGMDGKWVLAREPLHWLVDSPDPVHSGDPATRKARSDAEHKTRTKGAGLGLPFASIIAKATNVPIGLVITAHGGTSLEQWNPNKKDQGGNSLYGSMMKQVRLAGGKVKGVLWYQGESDALQGQAIANQYGQTFTKFIEALRSDYGQPHLPVYYVQIGRFVNGSAPQPWNAVQEAQRKLVDDVPHTGVVSVIDLELDDGIHVGTEGLKRTGNRLANLALRDFYGRVGATTPTFANLYKEDATHLVLKFKGVNLTALSQTGVAKGLSPERHITGFSIHSVDGKEIPLIYEAKVGATPDTVVLKLNGPAPAGSTLSYGFGLDPACNLVDSLDMAVPVFGPILLEPVAAVAAVKPAAKVVKVLIITGDEYHDWKTQSGMIMSFLTRDGKVAVDVTSNPAKDLNEVNLAKYDVLFLNYKDTAKGTPETTWSSANKTAFLDAVKAGKGLVVYHYAGAAFTKPNWAEFEKAISGGWRTVGFHGPPHEFSVKKSTVEHPISKGLVAEFKHPIDELYSNSMMVPGNVVLATAFCDPKKPKGTGKDEAVIWVNQYGKGRVYHNVLGHGPEALGDPNFQAWMKRGVIWAGGGELD